MHPILHATAFVDANGLRQAQSFCLDAELSDVSDFRSRAGECYLEPTRDPRSGVVRFQAFLLPALAGGTFPSQLKY